MKTLYITLILISLIVSDSSVAQEPTIEDIVIARGNAQLDPSFLSFTIENDYFGNGTDQYYTNGWRLGWFEAGAAPSDFIEDIGELYPGFRVNGTTSVTFSLGQNLYTPRDITISTPQPNDRPWAAWLYGSVGLVSVTNNHVDEIETSIGVVGPMALGRQTQKMVHRYITDSPEPKGWSNQLDNEIGLNASWQRRWPQFYGMEVGENLWFSTAPQIGLSLGNIYTHAETGINFRLSPKSERLSDLPLRVRPAMPGTGYYPKPDGGWSWSLFGGVDGRVVGRNIFLDGNTFEDSPSVDKKRFVYDLNAGVDVTYGQSRLSYTLVKRSKEFDDQQDDAVFGALSISRRF
jgi:lipid A 3-O-deacylase